VKLKPARSSPYCSLSAVASGCNDTAALLMNLRSLILV
jgi:hypothetical protein